MRLPQAGDTDLEDDVYDALVPIDGYAKGSRGGPRPFWLTVDEDRYVVVVGLSDFGDLLVGPVMPLNPDRCKRCQGFIEPGTIHNAFNGNQMFACTISPIAAPKSDGVVDHDEC